jgi:hypothetical protein
MLCAFFWVIPRRLNFICRCFRTLCLFHLHRRVGTGSYPPMKMEQTECSETSAYKIQTPRNYPEESTQQFVLMLVPLVKSLLGLYVASSMYKDDLLHYRAKSVAYIVKTFCRCETVVLVLIRAIF